MRKKSYRIEFPKRLFSALVATAIACAVAYGGYRWWDARPAPYKRLVQQADGLTAHRFLPRDPDYSELFIASYEPAVPPVLVPDDLTERVKAFLAADPPPAEEGGDPACSPKPGVGISLTAGDDDLEVIICLLCGWLVFNVNGERVHSHYAPHDVISEMRAVFAKIFPEDEALQALVSGGEITTEFL